jgi:dTDP-4-amino-4,6-dideoxygalactose transaminase
MTDVSVPFNHLFAQFLPRQELILKTFMQTVTQSAYVGGSYVESLCRQLTERLGGGHLVPCNSGTDALTLGLVGALGWGRGEGEVITVAHTFVATAEAIVRAGYVPHFVDVRPDTWLIDPEAARRAVGERTVAVMPVHMYGAMGDGQALRRLFSDAPQAPLAFVEDACQALGSTYDGQPPGAYAHAAAYSFYPGKVLGCYGDGGALHTRYGELGRTAAAVANHGRVGDGSYAVAGMNSRLDNLQAGVLCAKLPALDDWLARRREIAAAYDQAFGGLESVRTLAILPRCRPNHHLYPLLLFGQAARDDLLVYLRSRRIEAKLHYARPVHHEPAYERFPGADSLPVTAVLAAHTLSLPLFPEMTADQVAHVTAAVRHWALTRRANLTERRPT